ncbi:hypothetical protein PG988_007229 [Apiospora saccharicola]
MSVNVTRSSVLEDGILKFTTRGPKSIPIPDRKDVTYGGNALRGLNLLQTRYDAPIASSSLASALEYQYDHLPSKVRELITWISPDDMDLFPDHLELGDTEGYKRWHEKHRADPTIDFETTYKSIRENEYLIQQVDTKDDHYVTVILHLRKENPEDRRAPFTTVDRSVFVDPSTGPAAQARVALVRARLVEFMRPVLGNIDDRAAHEGELWVPPSQDMDEYFSSGLRAYILFEEVCRRLIELYCHGKTYDPDFLSRPTCAWTNLEKARDDMIGAASRQVRRYLDFVPRVTLALLKGPKNGKEDRRATVQLRLYTPPEVGRIPKSRVVPNDDEDLEMSDAGEVDDASSVSVSGDEDVGSSNPPHAARKSLPSSHTGRKGLPRIESDESGEEDLHQRVDDAFMKLAGGDEVDEKKEEEEAEAEGAKPASIIAASPAIEDLTKHALGCIETAPLTEDANMARLVEDAQAGFVGDADVEKAECVDVTMQDVPNAAPADEAGDDSDGYSMQRGCDFREDKDGRIFRGPGGERLALSEVSDWAGVQLSRRNSRNGAAQKSVLQIDTGAAEQQHNDDETPVFYGPQWPGEVPRPASAAARYLANRLDLQTPETSLTVKDEAADALPGEAVSTVKQDRFEIQVESSAVLGEQEEHSLFVAPSDNVEITPRMHLEQHSRCSSPPPAPADRGAEYADEDEDDVDGTFCRSDAPSPDFDSAPMESRPPTPAVEKSAKRKLSVVSDYDDDTNTQLEESPAKRQHTELPSTPEAGVAAVVEYDPAFPALGNPTWTWDGVHSTGSQIPGLGPAQEQAVPTETSTVTETQATVAEGEEAQAEGTPSYIA